MAAFKGSNQLSGVHGKMWLGGLEVFEITSLNAVVTPNRSDVQIGLNMDSKIISLSGTGNYVVKHVYSRGLKELLRQFKKGEDPRTEIHWDIKDPGAVRQQRDSGTLNNVWHNDLTLVDFEQGSLISKTFNFGFTPGDAEVEDEIDV